MPVAGVATTSAASETLRASLSKTMQSRGVSPTQVARATKLGRSTVYKVLNGASFGNDVRERLTNWISGPSAAAPQRVSSANGRSRSSSARRTPSGRMPGHVDANTAPMRVAIDRIHEKITAQFSAMKADVQTRRNMMEGFFSSIMKDLEANERHLHDIVG
jgi:hypothetical protein